MLSVERGGSSRGARAAAGPFTPRRLSLPYLDVPALLGVAVLVLLGVANLDALGGRSLAEHQLLAVLAGLVMFVVLRRVRAEQLRRLSWWCYGLSLLLLLVVLAAPAISGARRWLSVGSFTLQPSEIAKLGVLLALAQLLGTDRPWYRRLALALPAAVVPIALVVIEPDLSTATVLAVLTLAMLVLGGISLRVLVGLIAAVGAVTPFAAKLLHPYQLQRLHDFIGSGASSGANWSVLQAHIALAWGGLTGQARHPGHLLLAQYLPERESDLAFASLVEQRGIVAGVLAVAAASLLVWRLAAAGRHARTRPAALAAAGFATLVGAEVLTSVAANLGLIPTAGVPFPLLSYGGTAAAVHIAAVGVVLGLRADGESHPLWLRPPWRRAHPRLARAAALGITLGLLGMVGFAWNLQRTRGPELRAAGLTQMTRCVTIPAARGAITDRHGVPLALNVARDEIEVVPALLPNSALPQLAALTARPLADIRKMLHVPPTTLTVSIASLPPAVAARVTAARLTGVLVVPQPRRYYPYGALLGPVLGWTGVITAEQLKQAPTLPATAIVGRAGIEQQYDSVLRGTDGRQCFYVDPTGVPVAIGPYRAPAVGSSLRLTIDLGLQRKLTTELATALRGPHAGDLGAAVAMDPHNGQVLAMASLPSYDDNAYGPPMDTAAINRLDSESGDPTLEHVTQSVAPPGSTFKLVVAAADRIHHTVPPDEVVPTGGSWSLGGHVFHNWGDLPPQDLPQAIAWSNDVYFYKLAHQLGPQAIIDTARRLGVGSPTGIDLPGEYGGDLGTPATLGKNWYPGSTVLLGIGQGPIAVTPLQDALWTSAVATGATVTPHLGLSIGSPATTLSWPAPDPLSFDKLLGPVRAGMRQMVTDGATTAVSLNNLPEPAAGKTGTAEDPTAPNGAESHWLSAVVPYHDPAVEITGFIHGGPTDLQADQVVRAGLAYFIAHQAAILSG